MTTSEWTNPAQFHDLIEWDGRAMQITSIKLITTDLSARVTIVGNIRNVPLATRELSYYGVYRSDDEDLMPGASLPGWLMALLRDDLEAAREQALSP